jgi:hypothetical protein
VRTLLAMMLGVISTGSCLLTTSLDGLEGPPDDGGIPDGGASDGAPTTDRDVEDEADVDAAEAPGGDADGGADRGGGSDGDSADNADSAGNADSVGDAPILDGDADGRVKGPLIVANADGVLRGIAVFGSDVYWVQTGTSAAGIVGAPKEGGTPVFFLATPNAFDVAVDADYVYWSNGTGNEVFRRSIASDASSGESLYPGAGQTRYLAVGNGGRVYATGGNSVAAGPRPDAGGGIALYNLQLGAAGIAVSGPDLYWSLDAGIVKGDITGQMQPPVAIYDGASGEVAGIATDGQDVYWIASDGAVRAKSLGPTPAMREVCRARTELGDAGADARPDGAGGEFASADVAVDDQWVYFTEPAIRQISKCLKR